MKEKKEIVIVTMNGMKIKLSAIVEEVKNSIYVFTENGSITMKKSYGKFVFVTFSNNPLVPAKETYILQ